MLTRYPSVTGDRNLALLKRRTFLGKPLEQDAERGNTALVKNRLIVFWHWITFNKKYFKAVRVPISGGRMGASLRLQRLI